MATIKKVRRKTIALEKKFKTAVKLLCALTDVCAFAGSGMRRFQKGKSCGEDTGKGFDCFNCLAADWLRANGCEIDKHGRWRLKD